MLVNVDRSAFLKMQGVSLDFNMCEDFSNMLFVVTDDKDGHYIFELEENLTPRYNLLNEIGKGFFGHVKIVRSIQNYHDATSVS